ncbi:endonuclease V [Candidatus Woesearchaeota archaeon]|jgi:deoxyribonuclease V|nr:endonuclease V [Candidatus Woesearchaeota archaeon]
MLKKRELKKEQEKLAQKVIVQDTFEKIKLVAGINQAHFGEKIISAIVLMDIKTLKIIEKQYSIMETNTPYLPNYRAYREAPIIVETFNKLKQKPDLLLLEGNGILHPRRIGLASHIGILIDTPTIGISKTVTCGEILDNSVYIEKEARAKKIITKEHANPIFVSPGHKISLKTSIEIIKKIIQKHKLPEPLHQAHNFATKIKKNLKKN